jgi:hypothetical protein
MKRTLIALIAIVGFASMANAASLTVSADKSVYNVGEAITLTVAGSSDNDTETDTAVFAQVNFDDGGALASFVSSSQNTMQTAGFLNWTQGVLSSGPGFAVALNQLFGTSPGPANIDGVGMIVLSAAAPGVVSASFELSTADYFGAEPGGPAIFTIVPEPTTAGLLGMGLLSLAVAGRRR